LHQSTRDLLPNSVFGFSRIDASKTKHAVWQQITRALVQKGWLSIMVATPAGLE
jgi:hypothetical protein